MKKVLLISIVIILAAPVAAWAVYKPMRVLAPSWVKGIVCISHEICIEEPSRYQEAKDMYHSALNHVSSVVGVFHKNPRIIFCSTEHCYNSFGFKKSSATNIGSSGIVVSPRGWEDYYLRHEMIHHRQAEEFGVFSSLFKPEWLMEGMAYSLSNDARQQLSRRWQSSRDKFDKWLKEIGERNLWQEARKI
ncbi:MAG TPA: hypothetical protein ENJ28_09410 [Gammaproteobacteria bacterium]|nr:hypothetical protein [Gammaproteobacteria bacterium]